MSVRTAAIAAAQANAIDVWPPGEQFDPWSNRVHHKRKRPKARRAGCRLCKPNKLGQGTEHELGHRGFGNLRREHSSGRDLREFERR